MINWTSDYPTKVGNYWFYGWRSARSRNSPGIEPRYFWVRVRQTSNSLMYFANNVLLYPEDEPTVGLWQEMVFPEVPDDFDERFGGDE